jgi:hypothetical protein
LGKLKKKINDQAQQIFASTLAVKATLGKTNPDVYQQQLRLVIAMAPDSSTADRAQRLLDQSIEEAGDLAPAAAPAPAKKQRPKR